MNQNQTREVMIKKLSSLPISYKMHAKQLILNQLQKIFINIKSVAIYHAHGWELDLELVINYLQAMNIKLYQPYAIKENQLMKFIKFDNTQTLIFGDIKQYNLLEGIELNKIDMFLLPLVAIDKDGVRLGKGGGYYDRTLADIAGIKDIILCGVGYECQLVDKLMHNNWDLKLDYFVTELNIYKF